MTTLNIPAVARLALRTSQRCRNGLFVAGFTQSRFNDDTNQISRWLTKSIEFRCPLSQIPALSATSRTRWRGVIHTSPHAKYVWCRFLLAQTNDALGTAHASHDPFGQVLLEETDGTDVGTAKFHFGYSVTSSDFPSGFGVNSTRIADANGLAVQVDPDTDYLITVSDEQSSRIVGISLYEEMLPSDTASGYCDVHAVAGGPIFGSHRSTIVETLRDAWQKQASPLIVWASNTDASAPTRTSATPANLFIQSITAPAASSPGYTLSLANRSTIRRGTVPCRIWVYAHSAGAGNGHVALRNQAGTDVVDVEIDQPTGDWYTETFDLPATDGKYDLFLYGDGANQLTVMAVMVEQYEA